ncbi:MAG TPA: M42 family peptidase, partial [Phycisphaeraceae bacterium]|nr:M42 family peptidase [Phycisphaeraceae bacterium]
MNIDLLRRLCETPGIPGREERVRELILSEIKADGNLFDETFVDHMGSLHCLRYPRKKTTSRGKTKIVGGKEIPGATRVMLACHMDEIGFYVSYIDDKGFIRVGNAGGFDTRNLFSRRVRVCTRKHGDLPGVMNPGGRPVHIASPEERKKIPEIKDFMIDIGLPGKEVKKRVTVGDMVVMDEPFLEVGNKVVSKALDNRIACWTGIEAVRQLQKSGKPHACEIHVVFTVQEEVGLRGATTAAFRVKPDIALGIDTTLSCDTPGVPGEEAVSVQGKGVSLGVMDGSMIADHKLIDDLETVAQ